MEDVACIVVEFTEDEKTAEKAFIEVDETIHRECLIKKESQQERSGEGM